MTSLGDRTWDARMVAQWFTHYATVIWYSQYTYAKCDNQPLQKT